MAVKVYFVFESKYMYAMLLVVLHSELLMQQHAQAQHNE